jgi:DNA-binding NarL/FixJ family response regulator
MSRPGAPDAIRVLIVDDSELVATSLERVLRDEEGIEVVRVAHSEDEALQAAGSFDIDVVVMDYRLGESDGIEVVERIREVRPDAISLILTGDIADGYMQSRARAAGCAGILAKTSDIHGSLAGAVRRAHEGTMTLSPPEGARPAT